MDRRTFLRVSGAAGVTAAWGGMACARGISAASAASSPDGAGFALANVGLQLYTVRRLMQQQGPERTLEQVRAAGYPLVETAGLAGLTAPAFRALLDRIGLRSTSGHYPLEQFENEGAALFATATTLGQEFVVLPSVPAAARVSAASYGELAERMNRIGARARAAGVRFAYHNHDAEFETFGGTVPALEMLLARTDPALVSFELDAYWAYKAGHDPVRLFERFPGRFSLCHLKDGTAAPAKAMVDVGAGVIDFRRLLQLSRPAGLRYAFVEHDQPADALASIRASHEHLAGLLGTT